MKYLANLKNSVNQNFEKNYKHEFEKNFFEA